MKTLLIVESPSKARTIEKYLGAGYTVRSSVGHIRDLPKSKMNVATESDFAMTYEVPEAKKKVVAELKKEAKKADVVILASDPDREGEAIAWHLAEVLGLKNAQRVRFNEITKEAILKAIEKPEKIDVELVDAQQARRALDRLVGYELSPVLWKKVRRGLSAGRVQSVAVRLVLDREREIRAFKPEKWTTLDAEFVKDGEKEKFEAVAGAKREWKTKKEAEVALATLKNKDWLVLKVTKKDVKRRPPAPFTTSTLQQEASRKLGFGVKMTMQVAQRLYESGFITYMRTDSVTLSKGAIEDLRATIKKEFGDEFLPKDVRVYVTKAKNAQEAHEAVRPTKMGVKSAGADDRQCKLYDLIRKRTLACQMADAQMQQVGVDICVKD